MATPQKPAPGVAPKASPLPASAPEEAKRKGFIERTIERLTLRPDHTHEGFMAAAKEAILFAGTKNWEKVDHMLEEIEHRIAASCRVSLGVYAEFVARDQKTGYPRVLVITDWGFREAFEGPMSFGVSKSERRVN